MNTTSNKRKRESADAGDTTRSGNNKRPSQGSATTNGNSHEPSHAPGSSFSGIGGHDTQQSAEEMSALNQQLLQEHNMGLQSNGGRSVDATISAAKAASGLASSMGGLPVNDMSFASTGSGGEGASFGPGSQHNYPDPSMDMNPYHTPGSTAAQVQAARDATNMSHHKPPVGSPEWHAQRKSSHKEGTYHRSRPESRLTFIQWNAVDEKPSMRESMNWPRSSPTVRRTKGKSCSGQSPTSSSFKITSDRAPRTSATRR